MFFGGTLSWEKRLASSVSAAVFSMVSEECRKEANKLFIIPTTNPESNNPAFFHESLFTFYKSSNLMKQNVLINGTS